MRILGVIPARGGSKRIPRKNLQVVGDWTLVGWAVRHAGDSNLLDEFVVSTDDEEIADEIRLWAKPIMRPPELAQDDTPMAPVLLHAAQATGGNWDAVVTIQPTSPLRTARDIDRTIAVWLATFNPVTWKPAMCAVSINADTRERNGAVYVTETSWLHYGYVWTDSNLAEYAMPAARSLDINTPADLEEARRILG